MTASASRLLGMDIRTTTGVQATAQSKLVLFEDPLICANTSGSDFRGEDLIGGDHPVSVYLTVAPSDLDRMRPLLRILLNQITRQLTREVRPGRRPVLLMLDEFTALGPSESVDQANRGWARYEEPQASGDSRSASRVLGATASGGAEGLANGHGEPPRGREFSVHCSAFVVQSSNAISCLSP